MLTGLTSMKPLGGCMMTKLLQHWWFWSMLKIFISKSFQCQQKMESHCYCQTGNGFNMWSNFSLQNFSNMNLIYTGKTNALGYELYGIVGEANGQVLPLAFAFTCSTDGTVAPGAKDWMLQNVLQCINDCCPNIMNVHLDKDLTDLSAVCTVFHNAQAQLCYWHAIWYLEQRLAEDKLPAKYDPHITYKLFTFIDPTWAPGVTSGWPEDGVHEDDAKCERPQEEADELLVQLRL